LDFIGIFIRLFLIQVSWNYNSLMAYGFFLTLAPYLEKIYGKDHMRAVIVRYNSYFNTHPYMAPFIVGATLRLEKDNAHTNGGGLLVDRVKMVMMAPLAALGDSFFWAALKPAAIMITVMWLYLTESPMIAMTGIAVLFILYNTIQIGIRYLGFVIGYKEGKNFIVTLKKFELQKVVDIIQKSAIICIGVFWGVALVSMIRGAALLPAAQGRKSVLWVFIMSLLAVYVVKKIPNIVIVSLFLILLLIGSVV